MELISKESVIERIDKQIKVSDENRFPGDGDNYKMAKAIYEIVKEFVERLPTVDAVEVRHGHWVVINPNTAKCSECGNLRATKGRDMTGQGLIHKALCHYCERCGAKMDAERREG